MARKILNLKPGQLVSYNGFKHNVEEVYSYIAYLREVQTNKRICVCLGDLVIAGLESPVGNQWFYSGK